jgi:hypothetical protein
LPQQPDACLATASDWRAVCTLHPFRGRTAAGYRPAETICEDVMAHKKKHGAPVPPGNQPPSGPTTTTGTSTHKGTAEVSSAQEQDPKRRLGDFDGKGEHSMQEPGGKKDANH